MSRHLDPKICELAKELGLSRERAGRYGSERLLKMIERRNRVRRRFEAMPERPPKVRDLAMDLDLPLSRAKRIGKKELLRLLQMDPSSRIIILRHIKVKIPPHVRHKKETNVAKLMQLATKRRWA